MAAKTKPDMKAQGKKVRDAVKKPMPSSTEEIAARIKKDQGRLCKFVHKLDNPVHSDRFLV